VSIENPFSDKTEAPHVNILCDV